MRRVFGVVLVAGAAASALPAQDALLPSASWGTGLGISAWYFKEPLAQSGGPLRAVAQVAVPFRVRAGFGRWNMDLSGAAAFGAAAFFADAAEGEEPDGRAVTLAGPTDLKLRLTGPIMGDNLLVTAGLNIPTGKTGLNADETTALQALGAPALRMPVASYGNGAGLTLGVVRAFDMDGWALALGASGEQRTEYSPIALALAAGKSETKITPGTALHVTAGLDRALGEGRLSLLVVSDVYSKDKLAVSDAPENATEYQLGPQVTATTRIEFGSRVFRSSELNLSARMRSEFSDATGAKVAGSGGTFIEGSLGGVLGRQGRNGFIIGTDFRMHSGLEFTDALVGAALSAAAFSIGIESPRERTVVRWVLRGQYGTFDTGTTKTTGMGVTLGISVAGRGDAR